jgi:hypothetical protein
MVLVLVAWEPGTELASNSARCCFDIEVKRVRARACLDASRLSMPAAAEEGNPAAAATAGSSKAKERRPLLPPDGV